MHGALEPVPTAGRCSPTTTLCGILREIATEEQWAEYERSGDLDFAYGFEGVARFRANYLRQENGAGAVFRIIPEEIVPLEKLNLPQGDREPRPPRSRASCWSPGPPARASRRRSPRSSTRSTRTYAKHIVTIEDPVEFVHKNKKSVFSQREVGADTESFGAALRAAIRQDADVILVGEMRDLETIALALTAAEMGALVFGTLHTNGAAKTIDRLIDAFPADEQAQIRTTLAESLAGIVSQLLLRTADGKGRCAVNEILLKTPGLPNVIREGNTPMIQTIIQGGKAAGMQLMDDALMALVEQKRITAREAYMKATNKARFEELFEDE